MNDMQLCICKSDWPNILCYIGTDPNFGENHKFAQLTYHKTPTEKDPQFYSASEGHFIYFRILGIH